MSLDTGTHARQTERIIISSALLRLDDLEDSMPVVRHRFDKRQFLQCAALLPVLAWLGHTPRTWAAGLAKGSFPFTLSEAQWRKKLGPAQYRVLRQADTEPPFSSPLDKEYGKGQYRCAGCGQALFASHTKFDSGTGWPSFWAPLDKAVGTQPDTSLGMVRTEVHCSRCGSHLGHVFNDGPRPTGMRYCLNGLALEFAAE